MRFLSTSIGRKVVMAFTGLSLVMFACIHLLGNSTIFGWLNGGVNAYAHHLHSMPWPIIAGFRFVMAALLLVHIIFGISLTMENSSVRPEKYAVSHNVRSTFASRTMIWTGLLLLAFIIYHLLHFTFQIISPEFAAKSNLIGGIPDVFSMMTNAFGKAGVTAIYLGGLAVLYLHISHGIQSLLQTFGLTFGRSLNIIFKGSIAVALVIFLGYITIPLTIFAKILK